MNALDFDNESGLKVASFTEIREALQKDLKRVFGDSLNLAPSTPDGMLVDIFAYAYNALAQNLQGVITNLNVATASGIFLDYLANIGAAGRREGETDEELIKRLQGVDRYGYATYNGMLTYLRAKIGANTGLQVNEGDKAEGGINPHCFVVSVPQDCTLTNNEIAQIIFNCKPAGIKSQGTANGSASVGNQNFTVYFSRISSVNVWFKITINEYAEETLPDNYAEQIKAAVIAWAEKEYTAGKDVILQRVITPVFEVPGILNVQVEAKTNASSDWSSTPRISVGGANIAKVSAENITVIKL